jgi:hypothetical protein
MLKESGGKYPKTIPEGGSASAHERSGDFTSNLESVDMALPISLDVTALFQQVLILIP